MSSGGRAALLFLRAIGASALLLAAGTGCSAINRYPRVEPEESPTACSDGLDNDLDGRPDCRDSGCQAFCKESTTETCADLADNDVDGQLDCDDSDCLAFCRESEADARTCSDRVDNDRDGVTDCLDSECAELAVCGESAAESCSDGRDNDVDGLADCRDSSCLPFCREQSAATCSDELDNDFSGLADCQDPSCDGFCPEDDLSACSNGRDDDGDAFTDAQDPSCWPFTPPSVERCALLEGGRLFESFDLDQGLWYEFGAQGALGSGAHHGPLGDRSDPIVSFGSTIDGSSELSENLPGIASHARFGGDLAGVTLSFSAGVFNGAKLVVALTPEALAPVSDLPHHGAADALLSVTIDRGIQPRFALAVEGHEVSLPLPPVAVCGTIFCDDGWSHVSVRFDAGEIVATFDGLDEALRTPAPASRVIPPSRLVIWGGSSSADVSARIDDLMLEIADVRRCGLDVPQIPGAGQGCDTDGPQSAGMTVSLARDEKGEFCALLGASANPTASERPDRISAWTSTDDGDTWQSRDPSGDSSQGALPVPAGASLMGGSVVWDRENARFRAAVAYEETHGVRIAFSSSRDCSDWEELERGPLLPPDAEPPSYVLTGDRHELYFTRPATEDVRRTLWRAAGTTQAKIALEDSPLAELPAEAAVGAPISLQRVGPLDLVMTYRTLPFAGITGLGVMVRGANDATWRILPAVPLLPGTGSDSSFDADGISAGALSWTGDGGMLLYGGIHEGVRAGTARLAKACAEGASCTPDTEEPGVALCGDEICADWEGCESCPRDCRCPGSELLERPLADASRWQGLGEEGTSTAYLVEGSESLHVGGADEVDGVRWLELPLEAAVAGDFELSFDAQVLAQGRNDCPILAVGLGTRTAPDAAPAGAFARVWAAGEPSKCRDLPPSALAISGVNFEFESELPNSDCLSAAANPGDWARLSLRREKDVVSVARADDDRCLEPASVTYTGPMPALSSLFVGYAFECDEIPAASALAHFELYLLEDPKACPDGETLCEVDGATRTCVDVSRTPEHCGGCDQPCMPGGSCRDGVCECPEGTTDCSGVCAYTLTSLQHCGGCDHPCDYSCLQGECSGGDYTCEGAFFLPAAPGVFSFSFVDSPVKVETFEEAMLCDASAGDVMVFRWTPAVSGNVLIGLYSTNGESVDTLLGVTTDPTCQTVDECNNDALGGGSAVELAAEAGVTYRIIAAVYFWEGRPEPTSAELSVSEL